MKPLDPLAVPLADTTLIEASAGTGKTWTLATLYLRLLVERQLDVGQILVVTYTNAATAELRDRIRSRLREAVAVFEQAAGTPDGAPVPGKAAGPLRHLVEHCRRTGTLKQASKHLLDALRGFDEAAIFTIHGFCQRILIENAFESGVAFDAELVTDERPLCSEVVQDFWVRHVHAAPPMLVRHLQQKHGPDKMERLARRLLSSRDIPVLPTDHVAFDGKTLAAIARELKEAAVAARDSWSQCGAEVEALLANANLRSNSYPADKLSERCTDLGVFLERAAEGAAVHFDYLDRFTTAKIASCSTRNSQRPSHPFFALCDRVHAARTALDEECARQAHSLEGELVRHVGPEVRHRHEVANTQSFDDLLYRLRDALRDDVRGPVLAGQIRGRFHAALIDEFQDTDPVQYEIFHKVYHGSQAPLFLIGDPKQAIYAFRGADVFTYVQAKSDASSNAHTLQVNHRSSPRLVSAVNTLFSRVAAPFVFDQIPFVEVAAKEGATSGLDGELGRQPPLEILFLSGEAKTGNSLQPKPWAQRNVPGLIAAEIVALLESRPNIDGRPLHAGDIAVLCRTNKQALEMQHALRALGVPSVRQGDDSVFESEEAEEIERVLRAVAEPGDPKLMRAALATRLVGLDAEALAKLHHDETGWDGWAEDFRRWLDAWTASGFMAGFRRLLERCRTQERLLQYEDGDRRLTNVLHVAELLQSASRTGHRGPLALVDWLSMMRGDQEARVEIATEAAQIRLESDERAVQLVTIHRSKGLEYGVVYCPYTWDGSSLGPDDKQWVRFHDEAEGGRLTLDLGSPDLESHKARAELEDFAERLRLLYVAITRARSRCTLVWGHVNSDDKAPLGYLLHQARGAAAADLVVATRTRLKKLGAAERLAELKQLAGSAPDGISVRELVAPPSSPPHPLTLDGTPPPKLVRPGGGPTLDERWRVSSFSGLAASGGRSSHRAEDGLDHDAVAAADDVAAPALPAPARIALHDLPKGARTGELLHAILEKIDFQRTDGDELAGRIREEFRNFRFEARWEAPIRHAIDEVLDTVIPAGDTRFRLRDVARDRRLNEMQFLFGVRSGFTPDSLAACFAAHSGAARADDYATRIRNLRFGDLEGYLGGFIDLAFEHRGRWYVVDYKSNMLGTRPSDYAPARLEPVMSQHHYHLQCHLYVLAVQRYLTLRLGARFDFERDFGGVAYLFLRGMSPRHEEGCGIYFEQPPPALLRDLSRLVGDTTMTGVTP